LRGICSNVRVLCKPLGEAMSVAEHLEKHTFTESIVIPGHEDRKESSEFRHSKEKLRSDGHYKCFICGALEELQVHHFCIEWSLANIADYEKVKELCELFDFYGYSAILKDTPVTSPDDIRNMLVLCRRHHIENNHGIHDMSFPLWIAQKSTKRKDDNNDT